MRIILIDDEEKHLDKLEDIFVSKGISRDIIKRVYINREESLLETIGKIRLLMEEDDIRIVLDLVLRDEDHSYRIMRELIEFPELNNPDTNARLFFMSQYILNPSANAGDLMNAFGDCPAYKAMLQKPLVKDDNKEWVIDETNYGGKLFIEKLEKQYRTKSKRDLFVNMVLYCQ